MMETTRSGFWLLVCELPIEAEIGARADKRGRRQWLIVDVGRDHCARFR